MSPRPAEVKASPATPPASATATGGAKLRTAMERKSCTEQTATPPHAPIKSQRGSSGGRGASKPAYSPLIR